MPQLATSYEWGPGQRSVVLKLRPGVKFHDGEPFNAEAVRFNIERHLSTPGSFRKSEIGEVKSVDVINDLTVRLNLSEPLVPLLAALTDRAGMMVSPKAAKELGDRFGTRPVCAGPYKFVERVAQGKIAVERFADYWDKASIQIDRIEFLPITDSTARLASLRSGDLHMIERVSPSDLVEIRADAKLKVVGIAELGYQMIPLNVNNGPKGKVLGSDPRIRQAIDLAIDRETIVKTIFGNEYIPGNQFVSPSSPYYNAKFPVRRRDVAKARQLLREAGVQNLAFTLIVPPERDRQEVALVLQAMLAEAGITMTIQSQENVTMLQAGRRGDFEAYFTFWSGRTTAMRTSTPSSSRRGRPPIPRSARSSTIRPRPSCCATCPVSSSGTVASSPASTPRSRGSRRIRTASSGSGASSSPSAGIRGPCRWDSSSRAGSSRSCRRSSSSPS